MIDWKTETPLIEVAANAKNVDPFFIMAIREAENGGKPSDAFGVLSTNAPDYAAQLRICVETVAHRLETFPTNPLIRDAFGRVRYAPKFIAYFASIWAPTGLDVGNDPTHLNANWPKNVEAFYTQKINGHI